MSIKENIQTLKDELSAEERIFESTIRAERFVKKYQKPLMASIISLIVAYAGIDLLTFKYSVVEKLSALNAVLPSIIADSK